VAVAVDPAGDPILQASGRPDDLPGDCADPGAFVQVTHPATTTAGVTNTDNEYHTDPLDHEQFTRIRRQRSGLAAALLRGIGGALSAAIGALRAAFDACGRIGALLVDSERLAAANLGGALELSRSVGEQCDPARVGGLVQAAKRTLEPAARNCGHARRVLEGGEVAAPAPTPAPAHASVRTSRLLDFSPRIEPERGGLSL